MCALAPHDLFDVVRGSPSTIWATPALITELDTAADDKSPMLRTDLELWFASNRGGTSLELYVARRSSVDDPFGAPVLVDGVNSPGIDDDPWISADGRMLVFSSDRTGNREIWEATR